MLLRSARSRRHAASLVESALTYSVMFLLTFGVIVVALGVYYYQQVASLAREGARYASVHGAQYSTDTGNPKATQSSIHSNAVLPMASGLDTSQLSTTAVGWDDPSQAATTTDASGRVVPNYVSVTVSYTWRPPLYLSPMTLTSTSAMAMQY